MVKKSFVIILSLFLFFISPKVFASSSNYNTYININYPDRVDYNGVPFYDGKSLQYYLDYMINTTSEYYDLVIYIDFQPNSAILGYNGANNPIPDSVLNDWYYTLNGSSHRLTAILLPKIDNLNPRVSTYVDTYGDSGARLLFNNNSSNYVYVIQSFNRLSTFLSDFDTCMAGNCSQFVDDNINHDVSRHTSYYSNISLFSKYFNNYNRYYQSYSYNNNDDAPTYSYSNIYYSSIDLTYVQSTQSGSSVLLKSLYYPQAETYVTLNEKFLTYRDIFSNNNFIPDPYFSTDLKNIYLKIPQDHVNDFEYNATFNINIDYVDYLYNSVGSQYIVGRTFNNSYYSYTNLGSHCSYNVDYNEEYDGVVKITINSLVCDTDISSYDYIYITEINKSRDYTIDMTVFNYSGSINYGKSSYYSGYGGLVYEEFDSLSSTFRLSISSNSTNSTTSAMVYSNNSNDAVYISCYDLNGNSLDGYCLGGIASPKGAYLKIGRKNGYMYTIYQVENTYIPVDVYMYIDETTIITLNENGSNNFYYYNSSGVITNSNLELEPLIVSTNYDTTYYFSVVSTFVDGISTDINSLAYLSQNFYDSAPEFIQYFIFVVFILLCFYALYLLIRK